MQGLIKNSDKESTFKIVIYSILTLGFYMYYTLYRFNDNLKASSAKYISSQLLLILVILFYYSSLLVIFNINDAFNVLALILSFAGFLLSIYIALKMKLYMHDYILDKYKLEPNINTFYLIVFNIFYINYVINFLSKKIYSQDT